MGRGGAGEGLLFHPFSWVPNQRLQLACTASISNMHTYLYGLSLTDAIATKINDLEMRAVSRGCAMGNK